MAKNSQTVELRKVKPRVELPDPSKEMTKAALAKWNIDTKKALRGMKREEELPFDKVRILPILWERNEESILPNGDSHISSDNIAKATRLILKVSEAIHGDDGKVTYKKSPVTISIPGKSTDGDHITRGFSSSDLLMSIVTDPNWCNSYYIWPITDEDEDRDREIEESEEYQRAAERRKSIAEEVRAESMKDYAEKRMESETEA